MRETIAMSQTISKDLPHFDKVYDDEGMRGPAVLARDSYEK
jgi:hypothetical protein